MTTDATQPTEVLVLTDQAGHYYLVSRPLLDQLLERTRVPEDQKAAVEQQIESQGVTGFGLPGVTSVPRIVGPITIQRPGGVCPAGMYSMLCFGRWQCIPLGSIC